jgi:hypothetical protein
MASIYAKRLAKLEELLAARINQPLATLWREAGERQEECCARCGYDVSQISKITFIRWLDPGTGEAFPRPVHQQMLMSQPLPLSPTSA